MIYLICVIFSHSVFGEETAYKRLNLSHGISVEIPSHWEILSQDAKQNLAAASESLIKNGFAVSDYGKKERLLAVSALPIPSGAKIRLSVITPPDFTEDNLRVTSPSDLKQLHSNFYANLNSTMISSGLKLLEMKPPRIESFNNNLALVIEYSRTDAYGASPWHVIQYKIPTSNKFVEFTLSYRLSDGVVWKPILENVKRSVQL